MMLGKYCHTVVLLSRHLRCRAERRLPRGVGESRSLSTDLGFPKNREESAKAPYEGDTKSSVSPKNAQERATATKAAHAHAAAHRGAKRVAHQHQTLHEGLLPRGRFPTDAAAALVATPVQTEALRQELTGAHDILPLAGATPGALAL